MYSYIPVSTSYNCSVNYGTCYLFSSHDPDDEFVSESYQGASKKDMAEVNESMRRLGLGGGGGELNIKSFDVCNNLRA